MLEIRALMNACLSNRQVRVISSNLTNNSAVNGGGLSVVGAGSFLALQGNTSIADGTAKPIAGSAYGSSGGCVFARGCGALVVSGGTGLSSCNVRWYCFIDKNITLNVDVVSLLLRPHRRP